MKQETTNEDILRHIESLGERMSSFEERVSSRMDALDARMDSLEEKMEIMMMSIRSMAKSIAFLSDDLTEFKRETKASLHDLYKGSFTEDEKEEVLAMVRHYDKWLEEDTLGKDRITLSRKEYDSVALASGFTNRFQAA